MNTGGSMITTLTCVALAVYFESRDQELSGQIAVAHVVMNRVADKRWPDDPCAVVFDGGIVRHRCQFSFYCDGLSETIRDHQSWMTARAVATLAMNGTWPDPTDDATHYWAPKHGGRIPPWIDKLEHKITLGDHVFFRE